MTQWAINRLSKAIERGAVIASTTDTIWGFACHPLQPESVQRILDIKQRSMTKGLILLSSELAYCRPYLSDGFSKQNVNLPDHKNHPVTWLIPAHENCPVWLTGHFSTIAVRITDHPLIKLICDQMQSPVVSTSANRQGKPPVRNAGLARRRFKHCIDSIVGGYVPGTGKPSEIRSLTTNCIIRTIQS